MKLRRSPIRRCVRRVDQLERGILQFLEANAAGEMGNRDAAIAHLEHLMEERKR